MFKSQLPSYDASEFLTSWNNEDVKGNGSFACVRTCEHSKLGKVAIKCFSITGSKEKRKEAMKEVEREIEVLLRLEHKNIVKIHGITQWANNVGIVMECVDGGNLEDLLMSTDVPDIPWIVRLKLFYEIADSLSYIHHYDTNKAFVHCDLKPQNILLTPDLMIKLADFGSVNVAIMESKGGSTSLQISPSNQHTEFYSAPEILKDVMMKKKPSMDVYSLGMIGYEIITRHRVFKGVNNHNRAIQTVIDQGQKPDVRILHDVEKSLEDKPQDLQIFKFLEKLVLKCWEYEAEKRPDSRAVRNETNKKLKSLAASSYSYHINDLRLKKNSVDKSSTTATKKIELNKFHSPFEEAPQTHVPIADFKVTTENLLNLTLVGEGSKHQDEGEYMIRTPQLANAKPLEKTDNHMELVPASADSKVTTKKLLNLTLVSKGSNHQDEEEQMIRTPQLVKDKPLEKTDYHMELVPASTHKLSKDVPVVSQKKATTQLVSTKASLGTIPNSTKDQHQNIQAKTEWDDLMQQIQHFSNKRSLNTDDGLHLLSLWVQLYEVEDSSLMKRAAEYFPSKFNISNIHLNEIQVRAFSETLRFTNKFIEEIGLSECDLRSSLFGEISAALLESSSTVGKLDISLNQLDGVKDVVELISRIRRKLVMWNCFTDSRRGMRGANEEERNEIKKILHACNTSLMVQVAPSTFLHSKW